MRAYFQEAGFRELRDTLRHHRVELLSELPPPILQLLAVRAERKAAVAYAAECAAKGHAVRLAEDAGEDEPAMLPGPAGIATGSAAVM